jgi:Domain of unknown function (DUF1918)
MWQICAGCYLPPAVSKGAMMSVPFTDAKRGDLIVIEGRHVGAHPRKGEILEVPGEPAHRHFLVRWDDGHESIFYPSSDTGVRHSIVHH